jgi:hypothetical protein
MKSPPLAPRSKDGVWESPEKYPFRQSSKVVDIHQSVSGAVGSVTGRRRLADLRLPQEEIGSRYKPVVVEIRRRLDLIGGFDKVRPMTGIASKPASR